MIDPSRRRFLRARGAPLAEARRPPWALRPDAAFTGRCTRCGACVSVCPRQVLRTGDGGFPELELSRQGCSLCGDCSRACPSGALGVVGSGRPLPWQVAVDDRCLASHGVECRVCGDSCQTRALRFRPQRGGVSRLHIEATACTGCGDCLAVCPAQALRLVPVAASSAES